MVFQRNWNDSWLPEVSWRLPASNGTRVLWKTTLPCASVTVMFPLREDMVVWLSFSRVIAAHIESPTFTAEGNQVCMVSPSVEFVSASTVQFESYAPFVLVMTVVVVDDEWEVVLEVLPSLVLDSTVPTPAEVLTELLETVADVVALEGFDVTFRLAMTLSSAPATCRVVLAAVPCALGSLWAKYTAVPAIRMSVTENAAKPMLPVVNFPSPLRKEQEAR